MTIGEVIGPYVPYRVPESEEEKLFWQWVAKAYAPENAENLYRLYLTGEKDVRKSRQWDYFQGLGLSKWDVADMPEYLAPLKEGRPQPEKFGVSEDTLQTFAGISEKAQDYKLRLLLKSGTINDYQVRDILEELNKRQQQEQLGVFSVPVKTTEERDKARVEELRATDRRGVGGIPEWQLERWKQRVEKGEITQEAVSSFIDRREASQERASQRRRQQAQWQFNPPRPELGAAFEETRAGIGGTLPFQDWFGSRFPSILARFQATLPKLTQAGFPGLTPREAETQIEQSWAERLRRRTPELREEYATRFPFGSERYPSRFAPRITTVGF